jgi:hypothetical protein
MLPARNQFAHRPSVGEELKKPQDQVRKADEFFSVEKTALYFTDFALLVVTFWFLFKEYLQFVAPASGRPVQALMRTLTMRAIASMN